MPAARELSSWVQWKACCGVSHGDATVSCVKMVPCLQTWLHMTVQALCVCVLQASLAYKRCFAAHTDYKSEAYQADLAAVHQQVGLC